MGPQKVRTQVIVSSNTGEVTITQSGFCGGGAVAQNFVNGIINRAFRSLRPHLWHVLCYVRCIYSSKKATAVAKKLHLRGYATTLWISDAVSSPLLGQLAPLSYEEMEDKHYSRRSLLASFGSKLPAQWYINGELTRIMG